MTASINPIRILFRRMRLSAQCRPMSSFSVSDDVEIAYEAYGSSDDKATNPLIICHGLFGQKRNWHSICKELQRRLGNQIYAIDLRNHGDSSHTEEHTFTTMSEDIRAFITGKVLKEAEFERVFLLGHSMGGKAAARVALNQPSGSDLSQRLIEKLIIEDIAPHRQYTDSDVPELIDAMKSIKLYKSRKEISEDLKQRVPNDSVRQFLLTNLDDDPKDKGLFRWKCNLNSVDQCVNEIVIGKTPYSGPTLVLIGAKSSYVRSEDHDKILEAFPKAEFVVVPDAVEFVMESSKKLISELKVNELRAELEKRGLDKGGVKVTLLERLEKLVMM
ncbi:alpha/beta hydrolase fold domain-containing protein [Ditylenchus destructor]|uniref:sn-1-specific diacylglycerol lipase ABHD11 n=1 Tax=Ditylenchus destructor TaxID=166010 RepID=A0AAD4NGN4_9BILA|nr:alpha/beta hydrolase fold domain-containing protein [Ditylenchus destructor]